MMNKSHFFGSFIAFAFVSLVILGTQTGCEEATGVGGLEINPAQVTLSTNDMTVVLSVVGITNNTLALPLTWSVSDTGLGVLTASSGLTAVYRRSDRTGVNTITVRDQFEREGYAVVTQESTEEEEEESSFGLTADSTSIQVNEGATVSIDGTAIAPFTWTLSGPGSLSAASGSRSAAYAAGASTGVAQITVTDGNGVAGSISITVSDSSTDGDGGDVGGPGSE